MTWIALALASTLIGFTVGATGIGGFLLIPAMIALAGLPIRDAIGTALVVAAATGAIAAALYARRGNVDRSLAWPLASGAAICGLFGGWASQWLPTPLIAGALGALMIAGSVRVFRKSSGGAEPKARRSRSAEVALVGSIGAASGLVAGLTGVGGPLVSVPLLRMCAYPLLGSIGASYVMMTVAGTSGAFVYAQAGQVWLNGLALLLPTQVLGIWIGTRLVHSIDPVAAGRAVALLGIVSGALFVVAAFRV